LQSIEEGKFTNEEYLFHEELGNNITVILTATMIVFVKDNDVWRILYMSKKKN
jgi:hypothetical protein